MRLGDEFILMKNRIRPAVSYSWRLILFGFKSLKFVIDNIKNALSLGAFLRGDFYLINKLIDLIDKNVIYWNNAEDINLYAVSVSGIPGVSYNYKTIKYLNSSFVQYIGRDVGDNSINIKFICDSDFDLYRFLCFWCDLVELLSFSSLDYLNDVIGLTCLILYDIDCVKVKKVFRIWGLRPKSKPALSELSRENLESGLDLNVDFTYSIIEREI